MDVAIEKFLSERKADRIKKKIKANTLEDEKFLIEQGAEEEFLLENWLPRAAKRAGQLSVVSHPAKFSHPSAKSSSIIFSGNYKADGFLRSGNAQAELDVFGSAAAMDVYKFLSIRLSDGQTIIDHLELGSEKIKSDLKIDSVSFDELCDGFLAIKQPTAVELTDSKIKQVYFPVNDEYHLLSILSSSGLIYRLRNEIQLLRFSDKTKQARNDMKKQLHNEAGFDDIYNLSVIGYGGTKPQNISVLNSTYGGKTYLLSCLPPTLSEQYLHLPKGDFFANFLWYKNFDGEFKALHKIFLDDRNNWDVRFKRDNWLQDIVDKVINKMWIVRSAESGWSAKDNCRLPAHQKIWLDNARQEERNKETDWLKKVTNDFAGWMIHAYKKVVGKKAKLLGDEYFTHVKKIIRKTVVKNEEGLK